MRVLGHADPGGGFNAEVVAHRGFAYLASWGTPSSDTHYCPSQGVRIYDLADPTEPTLTATFGSSASEPDLAGTWTEKVMVRSVKTPFSRGDLAVASLQACYAGDPSSVHPVAGLGPWDVTDPRRPRRLGLFETGTAGVHELWLEARGKRAYVYDTDVAFPFVWGTFPYRGYVLAADINSGLWVFELSAPRAACPGGAPLPAGATGSAPAR